MMTTFRIKVLFTSGHPCRVAQTLSMFTIQEVDIWQSLRRGAVHALSLAIDTIQLRVAPTQMLRATQPGVWVMAVLLWKEVWVLTQFVYQTPTQSPVSTIFSSLWSRVRLDWIKLTVFLVFHRLWTRMDQAIWKLYTPRVKSMSTKLVSNLTTITKQRQTTLTLEHQLLQDTLVSSGILSS